MLVSLSGFKVALFLDPLSQDLVSSRVCVVKRNRDKLYKKGKLDRIQTTFAGRCLLETPSHSVTASSFFPYATSGPSSFTYLLHYLLHSSPLLTFEKL